MTADSTVTQTIDLSQGWAVTQDVHNRGELYGVFRRDLNTCSAATCISPWQKIDHLDFLQLLLADQPYWGRELRYFNQAPWYYRLEFASPAGAKHATLRFEGVDYYAKAWLNEQLLGEHEGNATPFEFEVGHLLSSDKPNLLVVRVDAPWDVDMVAGHDDNRCGYILRRMIKGSYEHADTFVQRDVNPVGIFRLIKLIVHEGVRSAERPFVQAIPSADFKTAEVTIDWPLSADRAVSGTLSVRVLTEPEGLEVARVEQPAALVAGQTALSARMTLQSPRLWNTWDRGGAKLYRAQVEFRGQGASTRQDVTFGVRRIEVRRTAAETVFLLNGQPIYLRGATYWPDVYVSRSDRGRYERDVASAIANGMNALRVHVHVENDAFYELCDRAGVLVWQDFEINWSFPTDAAFAQRAVKVCGELVRHLRSHPSIACWICMNESINVDNFISLEQPGKQLLAMCRELDPHRPTIRNSWSKDDLESGDGHDYRGSLASEEFLNIYGTTEKLNTEFGVDAPPSEVQLRREPALHARLAGLLPDIPQLHDYQYYLLKYYIEHYRIQKFSPCSGYFQFMWIDFCPQSFYGVYDYWGNAKAEGIGGGLQALRESNQPVGVFLEFKDAPVAIHAVNDFLTDQGPCRCLWQVIDADGRQVVSGAADLKLRPNSHVRVCDARFKPLKNCQVLLQLVAADGRTLASNCYRNPFDMPRRPREYPQRMDPELGMRLWWV